MPFFMSLLVYVFMSFPIVMILFFVFIGGRAGIRRYKIKKSGIKALSKIVKYEEHRDAKSRMFYTPVVSFHLANGREVVTPHNYGTTKKQYDIGDMVSIYYLKNRPESFVFEKSKTAKDILLLLSFTLLMFILFMWLIYNRT